MVFALPLGVGAAIYLAQYQRENRLTYIIRNAVDLLNGTPSIVFGLFGFTFLVLFLEFGVSLLAGVVTLGLMVLPTIIRTTEEALRQVPQGLREGSLALGATQWQTISRVVLAPAAPGIITGRSSRSAVRPARRRRSSSPRSSSRSGISPTPSSTPSWRSRTTSSSWRPTCPGRRPTVRHRGGPDPHRLRVLCGCDHYPDEISHSPRL